MEITLTPPVDACISRFTQDGQFPPEALNHCLQAGSDLQRFSEHWRWWSTELSLHRDRLWNGIDVALGTPAVWGWLLVAVTVIATMYQVGEAIGRWQEARDSAQERSTDTGEP
jgi:hypothetical protein